MIRAVIIWVFCLLSIDVCAQSWIVDIFDASNGLPSSECLAIEKDHTGHLWIGTTVGISRFNGYAFENFFETDDGEHIGKVNVVYEDHTHRLWLGSDAGLFLRDKHGRIRKVAKNPHAQAVYDLTFAEQTLYLATDSGPVIIPVDSLINDKAHHVLALDNFLIPEWKYSTRLTQVAHSPNGSLYFSGIHIAFRYHHGKFTRLLETQQSHDQIISLMPIDSTLLYAFTSQEDFYKVTNNVAHKIVPLRARERKDNGHYFRITRAMGIFEFDAANELIVEWINLMDHGILWATKSVVVDDMYWIATHDGLVSAKRSKFNQVSFDHPSAFPEVYSIMETRDNRFLLGSNRGNIYEKFGESITKVDDVNPNAEVFAMHEDSANGIWFATGYEGLVYQAKQKYTTYLPKDGLHNVSGNNFFIANNRFFVLGDGGVSEIIRSRNKGIEFKPYHFEARRTQYATFYDGVVSPRGVVWFFGQEGLARIVKDSLQSSSLGGEDLNIASMAQDGADTLWLAVNGKGILQCYFNTEDQITVTRTYDRKDDLPTDVFTDVFVDADENVWISHYQGISVRRKSDRRWLTFDANDGWPFKNYNRLFIFQDHLGKMWAGCSKGLAWFDVDQLLQSKNAPVVFSSLRTTARDIVTQQVLSHTENKVTASFYAIDLSEQKNLRYYYRLKGLQEDWVVAGQNREIAFENLPSGDFIFQLKSKNNKSAESEIIGIPFSIAKPFWQTSWFVMMCAVLVIVVFYGVVKFRENAIRRAEQQRQEREIEMLSLHRDLAKSKLVALRSQMNPHFIFNALNSIQQFVLQGNVDEANRYLAQFARLQRDILSSSDQDFIPLEKEISMLNLYLTLERLRSNSAFEFVISTPTDLDAEEIRIPPMLIQPFVENAVWHGLAEKKGEKCLTISFSLVKQNLLVCSIEDNGIGRIAAEETKKQTGSIRHGESRGLKLIEERMQVLRQRYNQTFETVIEDLVDSEGKVSGTRASVFIAIDLA